MHEETFYALCICCEFCVMWFWHVDVAVSDTEKENTVPLQSPQLGQAHQGWIRGTPPGELGCSTTYAC